MPKITCEKERELLSQLTLDDEQAFATLFHAYKNKLYGFILGITDSRELSKDIVQDVFLKIWNTRHHAHEIENFNAFVYRMARNAALDHLKRASRESTIMSQISQISSEHTPDDPFEALKALEMKAKYENALQKLPKQQRLVYELRHLQGIEYAEIAKKLSLPVPTIRSHFRNALNTLKSHLFWTIVLIAALF